MSRKNENIIKILISAVFLVLAFVITKFIFTGLSYWVKLFIFLPSYLVVAYDVLFEAAEKIVKGKLLAEDFLMSAATIGALIMGDFAEATFVMMFFTVGEAFEDSAEEKSEKAVKSLLSICPDNAVVIRNGKEEIIPARDVGIGEIISVKPGERIPIDGVVTEGNAEIDMSTVTGEAIPKSVHSGENVYSGTVNLSSVIKIKTTTLFETSTASKILDLIKNSAEKKAETEKFITKFAIIYTPVVVALAVAVAIIPSIFFGNVKEHIYSALTFLVVSCPCALVVSIPISFFGAIGNASKNGILVKGSDCLERFSKIGAIAFDKTGTLTKGSFEVTAIHPETISQNELLKMAASCEQNSNHPIAVSIRSHYKSEKTYNVTDYSEISGRGLTCKIAENKILLGNNRLMEDNGIKVSDCRHTGTVVHIAVNSVYAGHIVISDKVKPQAKMCVEGFKRLGIKTVMLTGDNGEAAFEAAKEIGIDEYKSALLPQDKVIEIEKLIDGQKLMTAFSGDGINDAPVLSAASVGIAMGALGSDAAIDAADIVIMDDDVSKLLRLLKISKKAVGIAKQNIILSVSIKFAVLILSALSVGNIMWFAAFADVGVLVLAVLNSMRSMKD